MHVIEWLTFMCNAVQHAFFKCIFNFVFMTYEKNSRVFLHLRVFLSVRIDYAL